MSDAETAVLKKVQMEAAAKMKTLLLRNNRGTFRTLDSKRIVSAGLEAPGASDLAGVTPLLITQEMVGKVIGWATFAEVKRRDWVKPSSETEREQENFINEMLKRGCAAFFINNEADFEEKMQNCLKRLLTCV